MVPWARAHLASPGASPHVVAIAEALSWIGLLSGMWRAYVSGDGRGGIELFGPIHGGVFIVFVVVTVAAARALRWSAPTLVLALAASIPPLATVVFDLVATRRGLLERRPAPASTTP